MQNFRALYGKVVIDDYHKTLGRDNVPDQVPVPSQARPLKIGILGAGAAGMYAAMIIDSLEDPTITYEILEADPTRHGGRLMTHKFEPTGRKDERPPGPDDYYDLGAMRFPYIFPMYRIFHLFDYLGITEASGQRIKYIMSIPGNTQFFNKKRLTNAEVQSGGADPFGVGLTEPFSKLIDAKLKDFELYVTGATSEEEYEKRFKELFPIMDGHSTRSWFASVTPSSPRENAPKVRAYSQKEINNLETFDTGSVMYDSSVFEALLDRIDFHWPYPEDVRWFCIHGGTKIVADAMAKKINGPIKYDTPVTAIVPKGLYPQPIDIYTVKKPLSSGVPYATYDHIISTLPFACLRNVDTSQFNFDLDWDLQTAIRCLRYGAAVKIAIRFKHRWWETERGQFGGVSRTDRPSRVIVYPSYGIGSTDSATMIVSYCWEVDALRLGAMCEGKGSPGEQKLLSVMLRDLSDIHGYKDYTYLPSLVEDYFCWNWSGHEAGGGGTAHFAPGQFSTLFPLVTQPHNGGNFNFAGEATSIHHTRLVGALDSAYRSIHHILKLERGEDSDIFKRFKELWRDPVPQPPNGISNPELASSGWTDELLDKQLRIGISAA